MLMAPQTIRNECLQQNTSALRLCFTLILVLYFSSIDQLNWCLVMQSESQQRRNLMSQKTFVEIWVFKSFEIDLMS